MPSYLDLPREVRDSILQIVLSLKRSAPPCPKTYKAKDRVELNDFKSKACPSSSKPLNKYELDLCVPTILPLLLVNHQLQAETLETLSRFSEKHDYVLDVKIVNDEELWPTWLSVPVLTTRINTVRATFQLSYTEDRPPRHVIGLPVGKGGKESLMFNFYSLLERFLLYGPVGLRTNHKDKNISIKTLEIDIIPPTDLYSHRILEARAVADDEVDDDDWEYVTHGHLLAYMGHLIGRALSMTNDMVGYGGLLYERIDKIKLLLGGCPISEYFLGLWLPNLNPPDADDSPLGDFKAWKEATQLVRKDLGLPVFPQREKKSRQEKMRLAGQNGHDQTDVPSH